MVTALTKRTSIVGSLAAGKRRTRLVETLDDAVLHQDSGGTSSSSSSRRHSAVIQSLRKALKDHPEELYAVMERRMLDDFGSVEEAPGGGKRSGSFHGWAEHRSRIPNIPATVRTVWGITGALDALGNNRVAEGKARLLLLQIDQLAVDRGHALLSAEGSLEDAPPFSSFAKHLPPDIYEGQHTKLWPSTWAEAFMWKVKELDDWSAGRGWGREFSHYGPSLYHQLRHQKGIQRESSQREEGKARRIQRLQLQAKKPHPVSNDCL